MRPSEIAALLEERGFRFRKSLGQNFLLDPNLLRAVADAGGVGPGDLVVEVGTGAGTFTAVLAGRAARVVTVELDPRLQEIAREVAGDPGNVAWVEGDALEGPRGLHPAIEDATISPINTLGRLLPSLMTILLACNASAPTTRSGRFRG